jgi:hypothetical protein
MTKKKSVKKAKLKKVASKKLKGEICEMINGKVVCHKEDIEIFEVKHG